MRDEERVHWAADQIQQMANQFQDKKLPDWAVGAIEGYCMTIRRLTLGSVTRALPDDEKTL